MVKDRLRIVLQAQIRAYFCRRDYRNFRSALITLKYSFLKRKKRIKNIARRVLVQWQLIMKNVRRSKLRLFAKSVIKKGKLIDRALLKFALYLRARRVRSASRIQRSYRRHVAHVNSRPGKALRKIASSRFGLQAKKWCRRRKIGTRILFSCFLNDILYFVISLCVWFKTVIMTWHYRYYDFVYPHRLILTAQLNDTLIYFFTPRGLKETPIAAVDWYSQRH